MITALMPRGATGGSKVRNIFLSEELGTSLDSHSLSEDIPMASIVRKALERYLLTPHERAHRLFVTEREARKSAYIPTALWNAVKAKGKEVGFEVNEAAQIALALYLQPDSERPDLELTAPESKVRKPKTDPSPDDEARFKRLMEEVFEERAPSLIEQLRAKGHEIEGASPAIFQTSRMVPETVVVQCGDVDVDNIVEALEPGAVREVTGKLAERVTEHSFIARAGGWSMKRDDSPYDIRPGDRLLMTPVDEFPGTIRTGMIILAHMKFKNGREVQTLKVYTGRSLKPNNPHFKELKFGPSVKSAYVIAICRGVLERLFDE